MKTPYPIETATNQDIQIELREVYVVRGANRAYLSEGGALNKLAYVRAQDQFDKEGKESNFPPRVYHLEDGSLAYHNGDMRPEFMERQVQVLEELKADVKRERESIRIEKEHEKAIEKYREARTHLASVAIKRLFKK
ncbi:hypothetical protein ABLB84_19985 [Xenorhabdus szentirmaii]|uniref:hypothetical protein n=1 Tax=Xenorhabdus szentirmaii TaxID=290112 RepID=UPI0032B78F3F